MFSIIVASHGTFSKGLVETSALFLGDSAYESVRYFGLEIEDEVKDFGESLFNGIEEEIKKGNEVLVITDMKSGSPFNQTLIASEKYEFKHLTGINLPTYLEILCNRQFMSLNEIMNEIIEKASVSIEDVSDILKDI